MKRIKYILILALAFTMLFAGNVLAAYCNYCDGMALASLETICSDCSNNREILLYIMSSAKYDDDEDENPYIIIEKSVIEKAKNKYGVDAITLSKYGNITIESGASARTYNIAAGDPAYSNDWTTVEPEEGFFEETTYFKLKYDSTAEFNWTDDIDGKVRIKHDGKDSLIEYGVSKTKHNMLEIEAYSKYREAINKVDEFDYNGNGIDTNGTIQINSSEADGNGEYEFTVSLTNNYQVQVNLEGPYVTCIFYEIDSDNDEKNINKEFDKDKICKFDENKTYKVQFIKAPEIVTYKIDTGERVEEKFTPSKTGWYYFKLDYESTETVEFDVKTTYYYDITGIVNEENLRQTLWTLESPFVSEESPFVTNIYYYYELEAGEEYTIVIEKKSRESELPKEEAEFFEKIIAMFIWLMGKGLYGLISVILGQPITLDTLIFDNFNMTTLTFFKADNHYYISDNSLNPLFYSGVDTPSAATNILNDVFNIFRILAIIVYIVMLVYLGIRMFFASTAASKKSKAKEIFFDWVKGIAILFLFPYVIRYAILMNHGFVSFLHEEAGTLLAETRDAPIGSTGGGGITGAQNVHPSKEGYMGEMLTKLEEEWRISYAICWFVMIMQLIQFLLVYLKRLITIMFLIAIFPLVTLTYPLDKVGDGKAQAFSNWVKEFFLQVFVQSFHAINYVLVMGIVFAVDNWLVRIIGITYVAKGGDILRSLFAQMKGGIKGGGPMQVAKSLVQAKVAIGAVKTLKKTGSKLIGSQSLLGKGVGKLSDARDRGIDQRMQKAQLEAGKASRARGEASLLLNDEAVNQNIEDLIYGSNLSDEDKKKILDRLAGASDEQLRDAMAEMARRHGGDAAAMAKLGQVGDAVAHATAFSVITGRKHTNINVSHAIDIVLNDRTRRGTNSLIDSYTDISGVSDDSLNNMKRAHTITVDESAPSTTSALHSKSRLDRANEGMDAILDAKNKANITDLNRYYADIKEGLEIGDTDVQNAVLAKFGHDANSAEFKEFFDNFGVNLAVQTINHSESLTGTDAQDMVDDSIRTINTARPDQNIITSTLKIKEENLHIGHMPIHSHLTEEAEEYSSISNKFKEALEDDPYAVPMSDAEIAYREKKLEQTNKALVKDIISGVGMTAMGAVVTPFKVGFSGATTGAVVGASTQGKNDPITEMATVVPAGLAVSDGILDATTSPIRAVGKGLSGPILKTPDVASERETMNRNADYYANQKVIREINKEIREKEIIKNRLEERLKRL